MATQNYNLPTITGNMSADVVRDMNALAEATDDAIKDAVSGVDVRLDTHLSPNAVGAHKAKNIALEDADGLFVGTEVETAMKELFTSVSNGKQLIGTAITDVDDSLVVPTDPTHAQLADLIRSIKTSLEAVLKVMPSTTQKPFIGVTGNNTSNFRYITVDTSLLRFVPKIITVALANRTSSQNTTYLIWFNYNVYENAESYANTLGLTQIRAPLVELLELPVVNATEYEVRIYG